MKKITFFALLLALTAGAVNAQKPIKATPLRQARPISNATVMHDSELIMTEKGVSKLVLGNKIRPESSMMPIYDHLEKGKELKNNQTLFLLMIKDKEVGQVIVDNNIITSLTISSPDVHLDNKIRRGMLLGEALGMDDVTANLVFDRRTKETNVVVKYREIRIVDFTVKDLSDKGLEKVKELEEAIAKKSVDKTEIENTIKLEPDDFNPDLRVTGFSVGKEF